MRWRAPNNCAISKTPAPPSVWARNHRACAPLESCWNWRKARPLDEPEDEPLLPQRTGSLFHLKLFAQKCRAAIERVRRVLLAEIGAKSVTLARIDHDLDGHSQLLGLRGELSSRFDRNDLVGIAMQHQKRRVTLGPRVQRPGI